MSLALTSRRAALLPGRWVSNELWRRARAVPSLDLRFAENKSLVDSVSGQNLITFTRASTGTYVDSDGVIRSAATNLLLRSEEFDNASWTKITATVSANATTAPNGASSADKLIVDNAQSAGYAAQTTSFVSGTVYTVSCYAKAAEVSDFRFVFESAAFTANLNAVFNLSTGVVSSFSASSASIQSIGNGWYRCIATATATTTASASVQFRSVYSGNGTSGIFLWGAQLEVGSTATTYIPTGATINSAPRFDHNPLTGECLGLLVEEQRQNLLLRSEEFNEAYWAKVGASISQNAAIAPNGTLTADKLIEDSSASTIHYLTVTPTVTATTHTHSVYAKAGERSWIAMQGFNGTTTPTAYFNVATGVVGTASNGATAAISALADGWYRCSITYTVNSGTATTAAVYLATGNNSPVYTGNGTSGIYIWGAQLEAGAFPTSYIKTEATAATRTADVASISGTNFSSWYNQAQGTVFTTYSQYAAGGTVAHINDGTTSNFLNVFTSAAANAKGSCNVFVSAVNNGRLDSGGTFTANAIGSAAYAITASDRSFVYTGGSVSTSASPTAMPVVNRLNIGADSGSGTLNNGHIRRLTYFPQRLPNSTLQSITL